ncbi:MAG: UDP-4-amino-4,6-dideoxy-N-acetyl-beta-L-altrosamine transaminase [Candidatus Pacebacteria bacterium]|nr:UDP-4-amino-4,6-dideoxy-N-acetyl-beta-L-altrosamine transaminase [Candidatus Paceibacterota bacterium]
MKKLIPYGHQWIDEKDIKEVVKILKSDWVTQGPKIEEFENAIAKYCKAKYAVAVSSGTAALYAAYAVAGILPGNEIITTPLTFAATSYAALFFGAKPVFADIQEDTLNIDPVEIEKKITKKTKIISPVDFAGHPCDYDLIQKIAKKHKLLVIEDAAHALGAKYRGKKIGSFSDMTILSFHPVKTITTGEGGMILTNDKKLYEKLKIFRNHGIIKNPKIGGWYYDIKNPGFNLRLTDFQSALGISQLKKVDKFIKRRREIVARYNSAFKNIKEIKIPVERDYVKSSWHIYIIRLQLDKLKASRKEIFESMQKEGLGVQVHYVLLNLQPFCQEGFGMSYGAGDFPVAEKYYSEAITIPLFPKMTDKEVEYVIKTVKKVINRYKK